MKQLLNISVTLKKCLAISALFFFQSLVWAQEKQVDVNLSVDNEGGNDWYAQPWLWVVGAAVFIIIIVALMRGGGKSSD